MINKNPYFIRLLDSKEFKLIEVLPTGLKGVAQDGEIAVVPFGKRSTAFSK